jgi:hypothetical protein
MSRPVLIYVYRNSLSLSLEFTVENRVNLVDLEKAVDKVPGFKLPEMCQRFIYRVLCMTYAAEIKIL